MKTIHNHTITHPADGQPLSARKDVRKPDGPENQTECKLSHCLRDLCINLWSLKETQSSYVDAESARRVILATAKAGLHLELDDADWTWCKAKLESPAGPAVFGFNAPTVREALDMTVKPENGAELRKPARAARE